MQRLIRWRKKFPAGKAAGVKIIILDVDGVMTDGKITVTSSGDESKNFSVYDGVGITLGMKKGLRFAFLSARQSAVTGIRAVELGVEDVFQVEGSKIPAYKAILEKYGLRDSEAAYMGDDIHDLDVFKRAGLSAAPPNASREALARADYVTGAPGGEGAVRELVELVLAAKGKKISLLAAALMFSAALWGCSPAPDAGRPPDAPKQENSAGEVVEGGFRYTAVDRGAVVMEIEGDRAWGLHAAEPEIIIERPRVRRRIHGGYVKAAGARGVFVKDSMDVVFEVDAKAEYESGSWISADRIGWIKSESRLEAEGSVEGVFYLGSEDGAEKVED